VISCIKEAAKDRFHVIIKEKEKLLNYFQPNRDRMDYKTYRKKGLHIGAGAIEAAHRAVIQKRMKLSGQRWIRKRAQNVLNLKACYMSEHWNDVIELIRKSVA
jgi:ribosomal protein L16/L10AE